MSYFFYFTVTQDMPQRTDKKKKEKNNNDIGNVNGITASEEDSLNIWHENYLVQIREIIQMYGFELVTVN